MIAQRFFRCLKPRILSMFVKVLCIHVVVQSVSRVWLFVTPWAAAAQVSLTFTSPGICLNSCPLNQWCHPTISSSVSLFSSCLQSFPASGSFPMSWLFAAVLAKVLELQLQHQSFQWIFRVHFLWSEVKVSQSCLTLCCPWPIQSMEFSRPEYWSR